MLSSIIDNFSLSVQFDSVVSSPWWLTSVYGPPNLMLENVCFCKSFIASEVSALGLGLLGEISISFIRMMTKIMSISTEQ
jgi:hypothetical protein